MLLKIVPSLFLGLMLIGCGDKPKGDSGKEKPAEAGHPSVGPHDGMIVEWGDDEAYHLEFVIDHDKKEAIVYVLGGDAKTAKPIKVEELTLVLETDPATTVKLAAVPQPKDPKNSSSKFVGKHDVLAKKEMNFKGTISATVDGKKRDGEFKEKDHVHKK